ncbi:Histone-binding protein MSI1 [Acorus calamus]|uniref:Histone-binding protein MSI1 n=1 Tax=Acorus calamus TaxID=4465 RepID=A0AAV9DK12_ACOCL|nr:Histone-binding protein MSI1 [Acorus calamus]
MISSLCRVPKGASKPIPVVAEPPSKEELKEMVKSGFLNISDGEGDEEMEDGPSNGMDEINHAFAAADALGKTLASANLGNSIQSVTDDLKELDMDHYDDEDDGVEIFSGNFIAIGSMDPAIEIWDLDIMDEVQPFLVLGGVSEKKRKGKKKSVKYKENSHRDAVLGLAWNKILRNLLASASADDSVKIWDLAKEAFTWNQDIPEVLLSGSFDRSVVMMDMRSSSRTGWSVSADVESLAWDPHNNNFYVVSLEDGTVQGFDIRAASSNADSGAKPSFTLHAHDKAVCAVSYNPSTANLLATGSTDKMVKLWDLSNNQPSSVASLKALRLNLGAVFSLSFSEDSPSLLAIGGSKGKLQVWDILCDPGVERKYKGLRNQNMNLPLPPPVATD